MSFVRKTDSVNLRGLLFDFDGLLVDTESPSRLGWEELYREHGHDLPLDEWATLVGTIGAPFDPFAHLEALVGEPLDREELTARRQAREFALIDLEDLRPGIEGYIDAAKLRGLRTALVSSSSREWIERILRRLDRLDHWDAIVAANGDTARAKPQPTLYLETLETLGLRADEAVAFEDSPNGVRAAKRAGVFCVAVPNPVTETLALDEADIVVESLADLPIDALLARLEAGAK
jgi:HAD superfamily hydrolase (TIGR01509 family)